MDGARVGKQLGEILLRTDYDVLELRAGAGSPGVHKDKAAALKRNGLIVGGAELTIFIRDLICPGLRKGSFDIIEARIIQYVAEILLSTNGHDRPQFVTFDVQFG